MADLRTDSAVVGTIAPAELALLGPSGPDGR